MFTFTVETYDHSNGQEEEHSFTDVQEAVIEFVRLSELMNNSFSVVLRREAD